MKMKFLNKLVSLLCIFAMLISPISAFCSEEAASEGAAAAAENNEAAENTENVNVLGHYEMNVLNSLKIVNFTEAKLSQTVTNEEFAGAAGLVGGISKDYYQDGVLTMLTDCGYMPSSAAYPDRNITYAQAVKTLVSVLGYDAYAKNYGGYPNGYIIEAANLKITDGLDNIENDTPLTYGMMCVMIYNCLEVKLLVTNSYNGNTKSEKSGTVLNEVFEIYDDYGRVSANSITSISGDNNYNPEKIEINSKEYKNLNTAYDDYFGYNVRYYYYDNAPYIDEILYMEIDEGANKVLTVSDDDSAYIADRNIFYYSKNDSLKSVNLSDGYVLVYNKRVTNKGLENYQGSIDGKITLIDSNLDGKYDFVDICAYTTVYTSTVNGYSKQIFDKFDNQKSVCLDDEISDSKFIIKDTKGNEINFSAIKEGNVVSVLISDDKKIGNAIVSDKTVKATIDEIENANGFAYIYSNGEKYPVADSAKDYLNEIKLGSQYQLSFDFQDEVAGFVSSDSVFNQGLIMEVIVDTDKSKNPVPQIKIFTTDGKVEKYYFDEKVTVDGGKPKDNTDAYKALYTLDDNGDEVYHSKFIRYKVKENLITEIDTAFYNKGVENEKSLHQIGKTSNKTIHRDGQYFYTSAGDGIVYDSAVTVFLGYRVDLPEDDEKEYAVMKVADFASGYSIPNVSAYTTDLKTPNTEFIVVGLTKSYATGMQSNNLAAMCFDKITKRVVGDEEKYCIVGWDLLKNTKVEVELDDISRVEGYSKGDMFTYMLTSGGEIGAIYKAYDAKLKKVTFTDEIGVNGSAATSGGSNKWMYGKPYASSNNFIYLMPDSLCADIAKRTFSDCKMVAHKRRSPNYYVFETDALNSGVKTYLKPVTRSDLNDYLKTGVGADTVLALSCPAEYSAVIIFR